MNFLEYLQFLILTVFGVGVSIIGIMVFIMLFSATFDAVTGIDIIREYIRPAVQRVR